MTGLENSTEIHDSPRTSGYAAYAQLGTMHTMAFLGWQGPHFHWLAGGNVETTPIHSFLTFAHPSVRLHRSVVSWGERRY